MLGRTILPFTPKDHSTHADHEIIIFCLRTFEFKSPRMPKPSRF